MLFRKHHVYSVWGKLSLNNVFLKSIFIPGDYYEGYHLVEIYMCCIICDFTLAIDKTIQLRKSSEHQSHLSRFMIEKQEGFMDYEQFWNSPSLITLQGLFY